MFADQIKLPLKFVIGNIFSRDEQLFECGHGCPGGGSDVSAKRIGRQNAPADKSLTYIDDFLLDNLPAAFASLRIIWQEDDTRAVLSGRRWRCIKLLIDYLII